MKIKKFNEDLSSKTSKNIIPSAVDFLQNFTNNPDDDTIYEAMIAFAKLHVEAALRKAHSNMQLPDEDIDYTLSSYPLANIK